MEVFHSLFKLSFAQWKPPLRKQQRHTSTIPPLQIDQLYGFTKLQAAKLLFTIYFA